MRGKISLLIPLAALLCFPGCSLLGSLAEIGCGFSGDETHCYQSAAVQQSNPDKCEKVAQPPEFKAAGSNPPKDKCYLMNAVSKEDEQICKRIQGGLGSYTQDGCVNDVAQKTENLTVCTKMSLEERISGCVNTLAEKKLDEIDAILGSTNNGQEATPEQLQQMQKSLEDMSKVNQMLMQMNKQSYDLKKNIIGNMRP